MLTTQLTPNGHTELVATEGVIAKRSGDGSALGQHLVLLPSESADDFIEVSAEEAANSYTDADYRAKVSELVHRRYSLDDEVALINNLNDPQRSVTRAEDEADYRAYLDYRTACKAEARELLSAVGNNTPESVTDKSTEQ